MNERVTCMECGHEFVPIADRITLRDYLAGCALTGLLAGGKHWEYHDKSAYDMADSMLKDRERVKGAK